MKNNLYPENCFFVWNGLRGRALKSLHIFFKVLEGGVKEFWIKVFSNEK